MNIMANEFLGPFVVFISSYTILNKNHNIRKKFKNKSDRSGRFYIDQCARNRTTSGVFSPVIHSSLVTHKDIFFDQVNFNQSNSFLILHFTKVHQNCYFRKRLTKAPVLK